MAGVSFRATPSGDAPGWGVGLPLRGTTAYQETMSSTMLENILHGLVNVLIDTYVTSINTYPFLILLQY
jgi:hypothetical protein